MVGILVRTQHGHCSQCEQPASPLYTLFIESGQPVRIEENPPDVHTGFCEGCCVAIGRDVLRAFMRTHS